MNSRALLIPLFFAAPLAAQPLPRTVVPSHYRVTLVPDIAAEKFSGDETIDVDVREPSASVTLNAADIDFDDATISSAGHTQKAEVAVDHAAQTATLTVGEPVSGAAAITIRFRGTLNDQLRGFYISRTPRRKYAVTQFESTDARRAFPSFDEPAMKATFDLSTVIDSSDLAISNTRVLSDTPGPGSGKHTVTFAQTRRLSTYLIALLIGDFRCREGSTDGIPIRVCTTPDKVALTKFALDAAQKELHFYNGWYGIRYPFEKLDIIGVPDFAAGAMENAGAITFREASLLVDDKSGSTEAKRRVAGVIAHELAHQWFGDLVTMSWWDDVWLNEGFATWMTGKAVAAFNPEWSTAANDVQSTARTMSSDALTSTRAIHTHAETPAEIESLFDQIAYGKTAAVLRMIESYAGPDLFRTGIRAYLTKFSWANASAEDFWNTMTEVTKQPLDRMLSSFVLQPGYPLVSVETKCEGDRTRLTLRQRRFFATRTDSAAGSKLVWTIPIVARSLDKDQGWYRLILDEPAHTFSIPGCAAHLFINREGRGYFRTEYSENVLGDLSRLTTAEKVSLLSDDWALVRAGGKNIAGYLDRVESLIADHDPVVVSAVLPALGTIDDDLTVDSDRTAYHAWVRKLLSPVAKKAGWTDVPGESLNTREMRSDLVATLADNGDDADVKRRARELAPAVLNGTSGFDLQMAAAVLRIAARSGDAAMYEQVETKLAGAVTPQQKSMYRSTLVNFGDPELVRRTLLWAMSPRLRSQDRLGVMAGLLASDDARPVAWPFVKEHWDELAKNVPPFQMGFLAFGMSRVCTAAERDDVRTFFASHPLPGSERRVRQSMERIDGCISFHNEQAASLAAYLGSSAAGASK